MREFDDELEMENEFELLNHFDSLKADFEQGEYWSDEEGEDDGDMDED